MALSAQGQAGADTLSTTTLSVTINGEHRRVLPAMTIEQLINEIGLDPLRVAVERNLEIVPRSQFGAIAVEDGDDYEIVHFVGGG
jgi:thiamine biosynthesis protein ThiS